MKGFTRNHKFVPMTNYKKVTRKSRDTKTQGVKIRKKRTSEELKKFKLREMQQIWNELDHAQRGMALEDIFPPTEKEEMEVRWSLRPQFKNAHTENISQLPIKVQNGLLDLYKKRIDEAVEITELKPMGSFEDAFTKAFNQAQTRKSRYARTTGFPKKSTGLNKVEVIELKYLGRKGGSYEPKLYQVNVNGKGADYPANKELAMQQVRGYIRDAESYDKSGVKINQ